MKPEYGTFLTLSGLCDTSVVWCSFPRASRLCSRSSLIVAKMSGSVNGKSLRNRAKVTEVPHEPSKSGLSQDSDEISGNEQSAGEVGQQSFGAPPDGEVQYVKGYPVIRSGKYPHPVSVAITHEPV